MRTSDFFLRRYAAAKQQSSAAQSRMTPHSTTPTITPVVRLGERRCSDARRQQSAGFRRSTMASAIRLVQTGQGRGRALVTARGFAAGERVFRERPLMHADPTAPPARAGAVPSLPDRVLARLPLEPLRAACARDGVRYPLLVAQMLVHSLTASTGGAAAGPTFDDFWHSVAQLHAHAPEPRLPRWAEQFSLLRHAFCAPEARMRGAAQLFAPGLLDEPWYGRTLGALHANLVRTGEGRVALLSVGSLLNHDCDPNLSFSFHAGGPEPSSSFGGGGEAAAAAGAPPTFGALGVAELTAARRIAEGEELTMPYVSPLAAGPGGRGVPSAAQAEQLRLAHGFDCGSCACPSRGREAPGAEAAAADDEGFLPGLRRG